VRSTDEITVTPADGGSRVTYEADLRLAGPLGRVVDPVLGLVFRRIGDRAAAGLRATLGA
jgi:carbon monoxide dehydrogenase subunit G